MNRVEEIAKARQERISKKLELEKRGFIEDKPPQTNPLLPIMKIDEPDLSQTDGKYHNVVIEKNLCSIIILSHERVNALKTSLTSMRNKTAMPLELILLETGSAISTQKTIHDMICNLEGWHNRAITLNIENPHSSVMINKGYSMARGEYIFIANDDIEILSNYWAERLIEHYNKLPDAGIIGCGGRGTYIKQVLPTGWDTEKHVSEYGKTDQVAGVLALMPRATWRIVGGYDENLSPRCGGDADYSIRCRAKGFNLYYAKDVFVNHGAFARSSAWTSSFKYNRKKYGVNYIIESNGDRCVKIAKELYNG